MLPFHKDFGPRFGFAYQALERTVLRGGFGLFYNASGSESINMRLARNIPFGLTISVSPGDVTPGTTSSRPNQNGPVTYPRTHLNWFSTAAYSTPAQYTYGNAGRNSLIGPGRTNFDTSLFKTFPLHESTVLQFRVEAFNIFNHPQFGYPNQTVGSAQVGQITSIVGTPRNLQASLRLEF